MASIKSMKAAKAAAAADAEAKSQEAVETRKEKIILSCFSGYTLETDGSISGGRLAAETLNEAEAAALAEELSSKKSKKKLKTHYKDAYGDAELPHDLDASQDVVDVCAEHIGSLSKQAQKEAKAALDARLEDGD